MTYKEWIELQKKLYPKSVDNNNQGVVSREFEDSLGDGEADSYTDDYEDVW